MGSERPHEMGLYKDDQDASGMTAMCPESIIRFLPHHTFKYSAQAMYFFFNWDLFLCIRHIIGEKITKTF